jgi:hypothetical protein
MLRQKPTLDETMSAPHYKPEDHESTCGKYGIQILEDQSQANLIQQPNL